MPPLPLIGYFPKHIVHNPTFLSAPAVTAIRSVSNCISTGPPDWVNHWTHNDLFVYPTRAAASAVIPDSDRAAYEIHAYRMFPARFDAGQQHPIDLPPLGDLKPLPPDFLRLGFDAVSRSITPTFEHSPLSCNSLARDYPVNEHCLLSDVDAAVRIAAEFSRTEPEPGPYYVVEVLWNQNTSAPFVYP